MLENLNTNFDPEIYMEDLDEILEMKLESILELKSKIRSIKKILKNEKHIST